ncbi:1-phosphofructokinase family hexose kinase [Planctomonas psychrotolerans]|uniref:1-phosphofructokinase family hexose kinase n=1 Tax=Planctomonas psychrotolerans TaxID=2528712 RepID=UPI0012390AF0|nr:1-phosphofructokinase family hexose kinase [Planctomonas psychrotolerans]
MIVTLTANPSLDRTIELSEPLRRGEVQRAFATEEQPGGKGVNVSRALLASGLDTLAVLPGARTDPMLQALAAAGIPSANLPVTGRIRSNVTLTEPDGTTTKVNEPGPTLTDSDAEALTRLVVASSAGATWLVLAGSLPPGLSDDFYARVIRAVRAELGSSAPRVAVDSSGAPLSALFAAGAQVDLIKPNAEELAELTGAAVGDALEDDVDAAFDAARSLVGPGCAAVLATLGSRGAVLATADGGWLAEMPPVVPRSTVGAGDSSLAGYLLADAARQPPERRLAQAVAHGSAAASLPGSTMPAAHQTRPDTAILRSLSSRTP